MGIFDSFKISGSALTAQRLRMDVVATNIANAETTKASDGKPFRRRQVVFRPMDVAPTARLARTSANSVRQLGVRVTAVQEDQAPPRMVFEPGNPDADASGYVAYPDIDIVTEMTDMMSATRAYEANVTVLNAAKNMAAKALDILRG